MSPYNGRELTSQDRLELLAHWINERRAILYKRRQNLPPPWTDDVILRNYRFCNVNREDDTVTRWLASHWRYVDNANLTEAMVLARMLNNPPTLDAIGYPHEWDTENILFLLKEFRATGARVLNPAYLITTCGVQMDKLDYIVQVADGVHKMGAIPTASLSEAASWLRKINGIGSFLSAQVIADLKNTPYHPLQDATDWWDWAAPGPGSMRGIRHALGYQVSERAFLTELLLLRTRIDPLLKPYERICAQNFQNCLCEFDKWMRTWTGVSKPKQLYHPSASS